MAVFEMRPMGRGRCSVRPRMPDSKLAMTPPWATTAARAPGCSSRSSVSIDANLDGTPESSASGDYTTMVEQFQGASATATSISRVNAARFLMQAGFGMAALLSAALIANDFFPAAYVDGQGLTPFKIYAEYVIIGLLTGALALLWRQRALMSTRLLANLMAAVVFMILSELAFTRYVSVYATANLVGHLLKIFA